MTGAATADRVHHGASRVVTVAVPRFPTLAEQLARLSPEDDPGSRGVLLIADAGASAVAPSDSVVQVSATTLGELRETLAQHDSDVLLSGGVPLTAQAIERLCRGLAADPSCATVSIDPHVRPSPPGVPPQTVDRPRRGAVLVRRDHLLLALDEEPVAGLSDDPRPAASEPGDLVGALLGRLERPGFVHRALPSGGPAATSARPPSSPSAARRTASVVFDGRSFAYTLSGTQVQTIGLLGGLVRAGAEITVALTAELHPTVRAELGELVDEMRFVEHSRVGRVELFHKPHQFWSLHDLAESLSMADRVVLTQLDMILERTPAYRRSREKWEKQRATTAAALASVDQIGFLSAAAALDAASDGELELDRATVVHCGVDHLTGRRVPDPACPLGGRPYLLAVGNAFWHKNRTFALRLVGWLVERQGWDGGLVLAGGHPDVGSSLEAEARLLHASPVLADRVRDLGHISDEERLALLSGAELTLFPSYYEGFGFVPFESAALGTACLYTYGSSMRELLRRRAASRPSTSRRRARSWRASSSAATVGGRSSWPSTRQLRA